MSEERIQFDLIERFTAPLPEFYQRRIIFWQDEDREFESMLDELYIPDVTNSQAHRHEQLCREKVASAR